MKNKIIIKVLIAGIIILVIALIAVIILYFTTDLLKPTNQLFKKYFEQDIASIEKFADISAEEKYIKFLKEKNYDDNTTISLAYKTSVEAIENFNVTVEGSTHNQTKKSYRKSNIKYGENAKVTDIEFLQDNNMYGILFSDAVGKYASVDFTDREEALSKLNIDKSRFNQIISDYKIKDILSLLGDKKESVKQIIKNNTTNLNGQKLSIRKNKSITLSNGNTVETDEFSLELSGEQTKRLMRDIFKELGDQDLVQKVNTGYTEFPTLTIAIYVEQDKTVRTVLSFDNKTIKIDHFESELNAEYTDNSGEEAKQARLTIQKIDQTKKINYEDSNNNRISFEDILNQTETSLDANIKLSVQTNSIKGVEISIIQKLQQNDTIIEKQFENTPNILLTNLDTTALNTAVSGLFAKFNSSLQAVQNNNINSELIYKWIELNSKIIQKYQTLQNNRESRFNNQFLLYRGNNVDKNMVYNLIDVVGKNLDYYRVNENKELKIYLKEGNADTVKTQELKNIIKEARENYNINFEFDASGKISIILLQQYQKPN